MCYTWILQFKVWWNLYVFHFWHGNLFYEHKNGLKRIEKADFKFKILVDISSFSLFCEKSFALDGWNALLLILHA